LLRNRRDWRLPACCDGKRSDQNRAKERSVLSAARHDRKQQQQNAVEQSVDGR
jgi:hypothetical protein